VKLTVSLQLPYKVIDNLGTASQQRWLNRIEDGLESFCFALTELATGSDAKAIQTTATYDPKSKEFVVNTPRKEAMKFWIGGAGKYSTAAVVFAQLIVGGESHGPHAFIVELRSK
jgi:acyl-CoA oxidase